MSPIPSGKPAPGFTYLRSLKGHESTAYQLRWSPDGKRLAVACLSGALCVWDADSATRLMAVRAHTSRAYCLAWSPDGKRIATGSDDKTVRIWDADSGAPLAIYEAQESVIWTVDWSPDGKYLASGANRNTLFIWDTASGDVVHELEDHQGSVRALRWSPDNRFVGSVSDDHTARIWDPVRGELLQTLKGWGCYLSDVVWSPDGKKLAATGREHVVHWWDAGLGSEDEPPWNTEESRQALSYSHDGRYLAALGEHQTTLRIVRPEDRTEVARVIAAGKYTFGFSPAAPTLAVQPNDGEIALWNVDFETLSSRAPVTGALKVRKLSITAPPPVDPLPHPPPPPEPVVLKPQAAPFDVFLCHNSDDAAAVQAIADKLKQRGLRPWIDREQIPAGVSYQRAILKALPSVHAAAVFLGPAGFGRWQNEEIQVLLSRDVERGVPLMVVLLPGAPEIPEAQAFLRSRHWVRFSDLNDEAALNELVRGISKGEPSRPSD